MIRRARWRGGLARSPALFGCAALGAMLMVPLLPASLDAQTRTITRTELRRMVADTAVSVSVISASSGDVQAAPAGDVPLRIDARQMLAVRTGTHAIRMRPSSPPPPPTDSDVDSDDDAEDDDPIAISRPGVGEIHAFDLPFRYVAQMPGGGPLVTLRPVLEATPLRYDADAGVLRGRFLIGLQDTSRPANARALGSAVRFQLISGADSITPSLLELSRTSIPYHEITVATRHDSDSVHVRVIPEFDLTGVDLWLPTAPWIEVESTSPRIAGLGVQTTAVTVRLRGSGSARSAVTLSADRGTLEPSQIDLAPGEAATVRLRSAGVGPARITASGSGLGRATATVGFGWPLLFGLAALLGGGIGGLASGLHARRGGDSGGVLPHIKLGVISGLMAATAYFAIGLNLFGLDVEVGFFNEAAVFTIAMIAGAIGLPVLWALRRGNAATE